MANQTLSGLIANIFPDGTEVAAYEQRDIPDGHTGSPPAPPINTQTVAGGTVTFTGLTVGEAYMAAGQVSGVWRYLGFSVDAPAHTPVFTDSDETVTGDLNFTGDISLPPGTVDEDDLSFTIGTQAEVDAEAAARAAADAAHTADTTAVHGITNTADIAVMRPAPLNAKLSGYGVVADGATDDTTAFGTVRDAAGVGGHVYGPPSTYILNSLILSTASQRWELARGAILKLKDSSTNGALIQLQGVGLTFEGGEINANRANNGAILTTSGALQIRASRARVIDAYIHDSQGYGIIANLMAVGTPTSDVEIRGGRFLDTRSRAVTFNVGTGGTPTVPSEGFRIIGAWADNSAVAAADVEGSGFYVVSPIATTSANQPRGVAIADCYVKSRVDAVGLGCGVELQGVNGGQVTGTYAEGCSFAGFSYARSDNVVCSGCVAVGCGDYGFEYA